jgi:hypothetical protein
MLDNTERAITNGQSRETGLSYITNRGIPHHLTNIIDDFIVQGVMIFNQHTLPR